MDKLIQEIKQWQLSVRSESENLFDKIIASCTASIIVDEDGIIIYATSEACKLFGYIEGELDGMLLHMLLPERFRDKHADHIAKFFDSRTDRPMGEAEMKLIGLTADSKEFFVQISLKHKILASKRVAVASILKTNVNK